MEECTVYCNAGEKREQVSCVKMEPGSFFKAEPGTEHVDDKKGGTMAENYVGDFEVPFTVFEHEVVYRHP